MRPLLTALLGVSLGGCAAADIASERTFSGATMGTTYAVTVVGPAMSADEADALDRAIEDRLSIVDAKMSTYDLESELSRFNRSTSTEWFPVSSDTLRVFRYAEEISTTTSGAFDATIGPLVDAWGFGATGVPKTAPSDHEIARLLTRIGYRQIELDETASAIRKTNPHVAGDLSGVAKGYAVDRVADVLDAEGHDAYLIEVGGEVRSRGRRSPERPWRIGIERPDDDASSLHRIIALTDAALATSGDYRNYVEHDGERFSHTIDPRTGRPVAHRLASVSVIDSLCVRADALATALAVLGPDEGFALAVKHGWAVLLITREADGSYRERVTPAFLAYDDSPTLE